MEKIEVCDVCGSPNLKEIKCKVVCQTCGTILRSCSDLADRHSDGPAELTLRT